MVAGDGTEIAARRFVIATGSSPSLPPIPGLDAVAVPHQRDGVRPRHAAGASDRHRRRADRPRACAGVSPSRRRGHGAGSGGAARARRRRMRRRRARRARARRRRHPQPCRDRAGRGRGRQAQRRHPRRRWGGDDRGQPSSGRDRPHREHRGSRARAGRHRLRPPRHRGRQPGSRPRTSGSTRSAMSPVMGNSPTSPTTRPGSSSATRCFACRRR